MLVRIVPSRPSWRCWRDWQAMGPCKGSLALGTLLLACPCSYWASSSSLSGQFWL